MATLGGGMQTFDHRNNLPMGFTFLRAGGRSGVPMPAQKEHPGSNQRYQDQSKPEHYEPGDSKYHRQTLQGFSACL
jgi:hypothetical protein